MNWYRRLIAQVQPTAPQEPVDNVVPAQTSPEPSPQMVEQVVEDFLHGRNVERVAGSEATLKTAGVTGHFRHKFFFDAFAKLPHDIKAFARKNFKRMVANPQQVGLKRLPGLKNGETSVYSAQVGYAYRALAVKVGNAYVWYWIGTHEEYNRKKNAPAPATAPTLPSTQQTRPTVKQ